MAFWKSSFSYFCCSFFMLAFCIGMILIGTIGVPHEQGFFCDDTSIRYPYHKAHNNGVYMAVVIIASLVPTITFAVGEGLRARSSVRQHQKNIPSFYSVNLYIYASGICVTALATEMGRYCIGRLRPHFISVCQPTNLTDLCNESFTYVENFNCNSTFSALELKEARMSFPSQYAAYTMFCMLYTVLYLQRCICTSCWTWSLSKSFLQASLLFIAWFSGLSSVSDNLHHGSDVLAGFALGATVAVSITFANSTLLQDTQETTIRKEEIGDVEEKRSIPLEG